MAKAKTNGVSIPKSLIVDKKPKSIATEAYNSIRTNIEYSSSDKKMKVIVVTSSEPGEGKTTTAMNLAITLAKDSKKVIIIDCDMRKPSIHREVVIINKNGLSEVILGKAKLLETMYRYNDILDVLVAGKIPPNPSEMLGSENMKRLIKELREHYDYVILDTPPVLAVTDSQILSAIADGVVFVVRANKTKKDRILEAKKQLEKTKAPIIGTVLNAVSVKENNYYYYYNEDAEEISPKGIFGFRKKVKN